MDDGHDEDGDEQQGGATAPLLPMAGLFYGLMFAGALVWGAVEGRPPVFAPGGREVEWLPDLGLGIGVGLMIVGASELITRLTSWGERTARILGETIGPVRGADALWLALVSAIAEELLFRGAIQPHLGWVGTSLLFGAAHLAPRRELLPWTLMAVGAGFLLGGLVIHAGDPGKGILLVPVGAALLITAVGLSAMASLRLRT